MSERDPDLLKLLRKIPTPSLNFISVAEYQNGLLGSTRPEKGSQMLNKLREAVFTFYADHTTCEVYAEIQFKLRKKGLPIPTNDIWIAALVLRKALKVGCVRRMFV